MATIEEDLCMPIAVIGMGCRFPGDATSPDHLWELLENGRSAWSEFPKDRINVDGFYHPSGDRQGSICFRGGHFLRDDIAAFDAPFFSTTAHEAAAMDPQQRILLEVSYEAFENAGIPIETLPKSSTAVYCGSFVKDYEQICLRDPDDSPQYAATGNGIAIMSNRISWFYDLRGPSMTLDTGCSASLVGVHLACQSLRTGESTLAIAMGAGLILTPATMLPMTALNFLSPDGKCFAFDERANGYGRGEGIGAVVLKPLAAALRDNDTIRAVIRGSGVNQDGRTPGITMPSKEAQAINIRAVYKAAGLGYDRTAYFEAHGTGTQAGDPTELGAISETFAETRPKDDPIYVGSVKTNIGHLEGCAGIAGLIKGVLMLEKGMIPTNLYFENVNPRIPMEEWKIKVPKSLTPWPMEGLRRVSINCFGFGGTNAHIILDDALHYMSERNIAGNHSSVNLSLPSSPATIDSGIELDTLPTEETIFPTSNTPRRVQLYALTAHEESGIHRLASAYAEYLAEQNLREVSEKEASRVGLDLAYTLGTRRTKLSWKAFVVSGSTERLSTQILEDISKPKRSSEAPAVAFAFSGQGAQWARMGCELVQYQTFLDSLKAAEKYLCSIGCEWSLMLELLKQNDQSLINTPRISQPLCTALQVALIDLLESWGVEPHYVIGHSSGEIAAAYAFGALSREDAWKLSYHRGRLTSTLKDLAPQLKGRMMAVALSVEKVDKYLSALREGIAIVACINSPESVTISGDEAAVLELEKLLKYEGIFARLLKVDIAYHSSHMKNIESHYLKSVSDVRTLESKKGRMMFSSVTGKAIHADQLGPSYWAQNLVSPVKFSDAFASLLHSKRSKLEVIIEIGPHGVLQGPIKQIIDAKLKPKHRPIYMSMIYRGKDAIVTSLEAMGHLWSLGSSVDLEKVNSVDSTYKPRVLTSLPTFPWNHAKTYWHESHLGSSHRFRKWGRQDLIGAQTADSISGEPRWRGFIRISENPWVEDHQVQNTCIYPAAGMISMALEAARQLQDESREVDGYEVSKMHIEKAMIVPTSAHGLETALNAKIHRQRVSHGLDKQKGFDFTIYSKPLGGNWVEHARGFLTIRYKLSDLSKIDVENDRMSREAYQSAYSALKEACIETVAPRQLYETLESIGMKYGPTFQNITSVRKKDNSSVATIRIPDTAARMPASYEYPHLIHPATLDAMFQTVFVAGNEPMVPSFLESLYISIDFPGGAGSELEGFSNASRHGLRDALGTIVMSDATWTKPLLIVKNLHFTALSSGPTDATSNDFIPNHHKLCAQLEWDEDVDAAIGVISLQKWLHLLAFKNLDLNILEINTDDKLIMKHVLAAIDSRSEATPRVAKYQVAGGDCTIFEDAQADLLQWSGHLSWKPFNKSEDLLKQGFKIKQFDLIIVRAADSDLAASLTSLLKSNGRLLEIKDLEHRDENRVTEEIDLSQYQIVHVARTIIPESEDLTNEPSSSKVAAMEEPLPSENRTVHISSHVRAPETLICREAVLILPEQPSPDLEGLSIRIIDALLLIGIVATVTNFTESIQDLQGKLCVSLLETESPVFFNLAKENFDAFRLMIKTAKGCLWVTRGGHVDCDNPFSSPASTLCKTIRSEDPQKLIYTLDLDPTMPIDSNTSGRAIMSALLQSFRAGILSEEMEYAERGGKLLIPRVQLQTQLSSRIERGDSEPQPRPLVYFQPGRPLQLEVGTLGDLDSLCFNDLPHIDSTLGPHAVEIEVMAVGIKMLDVMTAIGQTSNDTIGSDVSGIIKKVGSKVAKLKVGDGVIALAAGAYKSFVHVDESMCQIIPTGLPLDVAASLPGNLVLAYYSLITLGRLQEGESVLIHDASSALGQTAIQIGRIIGAEIFVTFSNEEDRDLLTSSYQIPDTHMFDIESTQISIRTRQLTNGQGVDMVLNNLSRDKLENTWASISSFGRFVELAGGNASDLAGASTTHDLSNVTHCRVDLEAIIKKNTPLASHLLGSAFEFVRDGSIMKAKKLIIRPISDITKAFREVQAGEHVVLKMNATDLVPVVPRDEHPLKLEADATYVLVGGLGGLGRSMAALMVHHGARNLAFLSRSGAVSEDQVQFIESLAQQGVRGKVYKCDICIKSQLDEVIQLCEKELPKIRGVIQGAAVIRDAIFDNMTYEDWVAATRPKMQGSWNLHVSMPNDLDFFVFLSSSAAVIGARGQANYASGNAFQDALAQFRRSKGQAAVSLDLGPILGVGMVAEDDATADILRAGGFFGVREQDFHHLVSAAITNFTEDGTPTPSQIIIATGTGGLVKQNQVADPYWYREARFSHMKFIDLAPSTSGPDEVNMQDMLTACTSMDEAKMTVLEGLKALLAKSMNMLPGDLDTRKAASAYGVDSLVAVGTRNWIFRETGVDVSVFEILSEVAIEELAGQVAGKSRFVGVELRDEEAEEGEAEQ